MRYVPAELNQWRLIPAFKADDSIEILKEPIIEWGIGADGCNTTMKTTTGIHKVKGSFIRIGNAVVPPENADDSCDDLGVDELPAWLREHPQFLSRAPKARSCSGD